MTYFLFISRCMSFSHTSMTGAELFNLLLVLFPADLVAMVTDDMAMLDVDADRGRMGFDL